MYYLLIALAALLFSSQFMFNNGFQKENETGWNSTVKLTFYTSVIGFVITLIVNKFALNFSLFSWEIATIYAFVCILLNYCTIKVFEYASLSVYSVFSMIGGMALPFVYGLTKGEELKLSKIICFLLISLSIILMMKRDKKSNKAFLYYMGVFILNGMVGVISSYHQSKTLLCVDSGSFLMLTKIIMTVLSLLVMLKTKDYKLSTKSCLYCVGISGFNSIANLMLLFALLHLPTSVQYPMVTGGTIVFSTVIDLIRKEKVSIREIIAVIIAFISSIFMAM